MTYILPSYADRDASGPGFHGNFHNKAGNSTLLPEVTILWITWRFPTQGSKLAAACQVSFMIVRTVRASDARQ